MKKAIFSVIIILFLNTVAFTASLAPESLFAKANELYKNKNYKDAITLYQNIIKLGYHSSELYFNIGNAYFKTKNYPYAILYYEKAKLLDPSNDDIIFNLTKAKIYTIDKIETIPEFFIKSWLDHFTLHYSSNIWAIVALLFFGIAILMLCGYFLIQSLRIRKLMFFISILMFVLTVFTLTFAYKSRNYVLNPGTAIIISPTISVKASPDYDAVDEFVLHEGTKVFLLRKIGDWFEIKLTDGKKGWLEANSIEKI